MLRLGLTGGIGSGKSAVARRLRAHGAVVVDADVLARQVVEPGTPGLRAVVDAFGTEVLSDDGSLDRQRLGRVVFADPDARARLNAIVHPLVGAATAACFAAAAPDAVVVHDVPLLAENGLAPAYHLVVVVEAPPAVRVERLARDRGMRPADAQARIDAQATDAQRREVADVLLVNDGTPDALGAAVDAVWTGRVAPYAANLAADRPAPPPPPRLVGPDPTWPAQFARVAARIRAAVPERALVVDHVGWTAVPGLAANDVLDAQLTVGSVGDADALADGLEGYGLLRLAGVTADTPPVGQDADPAQWVKRLHVGADPGRPVRVHIRVAGRANQRLALLVRDYLRADPAAAAAYLEAERRLVALHAHDDTAYAEATQRRRDRVAADAEAWAGACGWAPG